jgi:hypothetical protein
MFIDPAPEAALLGRCDRPRRLRTAQTQHRSEA